MSAIKIDTDPFFHTEPTEDHPVAVWGNVNNVAISACAPRAMPDVAVAQSVQNLTPAAKGKWRCIDIASVRRGPSTPSLCQHYPGRLHWYLTTLDVGSISSRSS